MIPLPYRPIFMSWGVARDSPRAHLGHQGAHGGGDGKLGPGWIRIWASTDPSEPNIFMDDRKEAEKWGHLEELHLWMKHVVGLMSDIVNNGLGLAYFVSVFGP